MIIAPDQITQWLLAYKYLALFPLTVVEGPIITVIAGFFVSLGYVNFFWVYVVVMAGDLGGDALHYLAGRWGGRRFVDRWGKYLGIGPDQVDFLEKQFARRGSRLIFIGKMSHGIGGAFLVAAGLIKMPFGQFMFSNLLATFVKSFLLLLVGYYFGRALLTISSALERIAVISIGAAVLAFLIYFFYFRKKRNKFT